MKISFIGAGSMAEAIISGIIRQRLMDSHDIFVTNRSDHEKLKLLQEKYDITITYNLEKLFDKTEMVVLAVKPKDAHVALQNIRPYLKSTLLLSVLAGISISYIEKIIDHHSPIIRAMPNTSAMVGQSATAIALNEHVTKQQEKFAINLLSAIGATTIVEENKLDAITGLSGSGPAYIYYVIEAMEQSATEIGLEYNEAKELIRQTLIGAAEMLNTSSNSSAELRKSVTSPGGTTEAGIRVLDQNSVKEAIINCIKEATAQSKRLAKTHESTPEIPL